jgi:hypothetical protein
VKIKDCNIDDVVELFLDSNRRISWVPTSLVHTGTVVAMFYGNKVAIIAWKDKVSAYSNAAPFEPLKSTLIGMRVMLVAIGMDISDNIDDYEYAVMVSFDAEVSVPVPPTQPSPEHPTTKLEAVKTYGQHCSRCNDYNEYAEQEPGKIYTCYS